MPQATTTDQEILGRTATIATAMARALSEGGVRAVFGLDDPQALWHALRASPDIETVVVHDERSAAFMADAYARKTGEVGVCGAISGPGGTNLATGLLEARTAHVPVVAIVGEAPPPPIGGHSFQAAPHEQILAPLVKEVVRITAPEQAYDATRRALDLARAGRPGPVLILADDEFLWQPFEPDGTYGDGPSRRPSTVTAVPDPATIEIVSRELALADRPVLFAGGGSNPDAAEALLELAEALNAPVVTSMMGKGVISDSHPLSIGVASAYNGSPRGRGYVAHELLAEADVLVIVGSDLDSVTTSGGAWPRPQTTVVRIDIHPGELVGRPGMHLLGDAAETLRHLRASLDKVERREWTDRAIEMATAQERELAELDARPIEGSVWPGALARAIGESVAPGDAVVTDASYSSAWIIDRLRQGFAGRTVLAPRGSGVLGWGLPAAVGAKVAAPESRVTLVTGDGGLLFTIGELETVVRLELAMSVVLLNNKSFGYQRQADMLWQGQDDMPDLRFGERTDYARIAAGFGWHAVRVADLEAFRESYRDALSRDVPSLIEVAVDPDVRPPITRMDLDP